MKEKFKQIPQPLRKQILLRCVGAGLSLAMLLFVLVYSRDWRFFIPCVVVAWKCKQYAGYSGFNGAGVF